MGDLFNGPLAFYGCTSEGNASSNIQSQTVTACSQQLNHACLMATALRSSVHYISLIILFIVSYTQILGILPSLLHAEKPDFRPPANSTPYRQIQEVHSLLDMNRSVYVPTQTTNSVRQGPLLASQTSYLLPSGPRVLDLASIPP